MAFQGLCALVNATLRHSRWTRTNPNMCQPAVPAQHRVALAPKIVRKCSRGAGVQSWLSMAPLPRPHGLNRASTLICTEHALQSVPTCSHLLFSCLILHLFSCSSNRLTSGIRLTTGENVNRVSIICFSLQQITINHAWNGRAY